MFVARQDYQVLLYQTTHSKRATKHFKCVIQRPFFQFLFKILTHQGAYFNVNMM